MKTALRFLSFFILLITSVKVTGQINFRSKSEASTQGATITFTKPSNLANGDLMILMISSKDANNAIQPADFPVGWTGIYRGDVGGSNRRTSLIAYRLATATELSSFTFDVPGTNTGNAGDVSAGAILAFSGINRSTPVEVVGSVGGTATTTTAVTVPSINTLSNSAAIVMLGLQSGDDRAAWATWNTTSPGTLTEIVDFGASITTNNTNHGVSVAAAWAAKTGAGATGAGTATLTPSDRYVSLLISLKSAIENLPVTLTSFTTKPATNNKVSLGWATSSEQVNKGFSIERQSNNTNGKFESIGFVASKAPGGNSQTQLYYSFTDEMPSASATNFYRLAQQDLDGKVSYSEVRSLKLGKETVTMVSPNPSNGAVNISRTADGKKMNIQVIDQSGKIIRQVNNIADANYKLNIQKSGVYTIKMNYPETGEQSIQRIVVQK
jgi:hypothetical protein